MSQDGVGRATAGVDDEAADELRDLFDHAPCAYHCLDASGLYVRVNATEARWLGRAAEDLVGRVRFVEVLWPESAAAYELRMAEGRGRLPMTDLALDLRGPNGTRKRVLWCSNAICDARGNLALLRAVMLERSASASGVMPRAEPSTDADRWRELLRGVETRAEGIDSAVKTLLRHLDYLEGELSVGRALQHTLADLRDAAMRSHSLAHEIVALGRDRGPRR